MIMCFTNMYICFSTDLQQTFGLHPHFLVCSHSVSLSSLSSLHIVLFANSVHTFVFFLALFPFTDFPFLFLSFPSILYDLFSHALYIHPLSSGVLHSSAEKSKGGWGVLGGGGCTDWKGLCVCVSLLCFARLNAGSACLPPLLLLLVWSPSKLYDLFSQRQRSKTPSDHRESSARGFNDFTTKMSAMAGAALSGTRRERERERERHIALTAHIHLLTDSHSYLGRLPNIDINRKQEKLIATLYAYVGSIPMYIWC